MFGVVKYWRKWCEFSTKLGNLGLLILSRKFWAPGFTRKKSFSTVTLRLEGEIFFVFYDSYSALQVFNSELQITNNCCFIAVNKFHYRFWNDGRASWLAWQRNKNFAARISVIEKCASFRPAWGSDRQRVEPSLGNLYLILEQRRTSSPRIYFFRPAERLFEAFSRFFLIVFYFQNGN